MAGSDDEGASERCEPNDADGVSGEGGESPPEWWKPTPPQEAPPDPVLAEAAEAMRKADILVFVAGEEVPPDPGFEFMRSIEKQVPVACTLILPVRGRWECKGWPNDRVVELRPPSATFPDELEEQIIADTQKKVLGGARTFQEHNASFSLVFVDIGGGQLPAQTRQDLYSPFEELSCSVFVTLGPGAEGAQFNHKVAQHLHVGLDLQAAFAWLQRDLARIEMASFLLYDDVVHWVSHLAPHSGLGNGAEVLMPRDSTALRIYRKVCTEFGDSSFPNLLAEPPLITYSIYNVTIRRVLSPADSVPWQFFSKTGDDMPLLAKLSVYSDGLIRFPCRTQQLLDRRAAVLAILSEMVRKFKSEEYQTKLALVRDQIELRAMIKAVHLTILPKNGFHLTKESKSHEDMKMQTRMQTYLYSGLLEPEDDWVGNLSLQLSGISKLPTLPFRYKGAPAQVHTRTLPGNFKPYEGVERQRPLFGGWFGWRRVPAFFVATSADEMVEYLRADPDGPFAGRLDEWPDKGKSLPANARWQRWGFTEDSKETVLKTDWHALPRFTDTAELFVPRNAKRDDTIKAPPRFLAFAEAFRTVNSGCWKQLAEALQALKTTHEKSGSKIWEERGGSGLVDDMIKSFTSHGLFGIIEAQVWWGAGPLVLPSHKDGATSLLHLSLTLGGARTLRLGLFKSMLAGGAVMPEDQWWVKEPEDPDAGKVNEDVWDNASWEKSLASGVGVLEDIRMARGSCYISSPYCFEHGVRYETGSRDDPVIALQCRFAFDPELGKKLNGRRDSAMWEISNAMSKTLQAAAERGELRMPTVDEVATVAYGLMKQGSTTAEAAGTPQELRMSMVDKVATVAMGLTRQGYTLTEAMQVASTGRSAQPIPVDTKPVKQALPVASSGHAPGAAAGTTANPAPVAAGAAAAPPGHPVDVPAKEPDGDAERESQRWARAPLDYREKEDLAKRDRAFKEAAKEREKLREQARMARIKVGEVEEDGGSSADEEVQITIRQGQKGGQVVVTVPGCATMLEVKKALVQKLGRGLVRKVQLVKEKGHSFEAYSDQERLHGRRELVMLGLNLNARAA